MDYFEKLFLALMLSIMIIISAGIWATKANNDTYQQKNVMIMASWGDSDMLKRINSVPYNEHFNAVLTFRDPMELYSPIVRKHMIELRQ